MWTSPEGTGRERQWEGPGAGLMHHQNISCYLGGCKVASPWWNADVCGQISGVKNLVKNWYVNNRGEKTLMDWWYPWNFIDKQRFSWKYKLSDEKCVIVTLHYFTPQKNIESPTWANVPLEGSRNTRHWSSDFKLTFHRPHFNKSPLKVTGCGYIMTITMCTVSLFYPATALL